MKETIITCDHCNEKITNKYYQNIGTMVNPNYCDGGATMDVFMSSDDGDKQFCSLLCLRNWAKIK